MNADGLTPIHLVTGDIGRGWRRLILRSQGMGNNDTVQGKIRNKLWSSGVWVDCETHHQQRIKQSGINREVAALDTQ